MFFSAPTIVMTQLHADAASVNKHLLPLLSKCSSCLAPAPVLFTFHERSNQITAKIGIFQHDVQPLTRPDSISILAPCFPANPPQLTLTGTLRDSNPEDGEAGGCSQTLTPPCCCHNTIKNQSCTSCFASAPSNLEVEKGCAAN